MSEPPGQQSRGRKQDKQRQQAQNESRAKERRRTPKRTRPQPSQEIGQPDKQQQAGTEIVSETVVEGADGACNIEIEHVNVPVGNDQPSYEVVTTLPDNQLQVEYRQLNWVKTYTGVGQVQTDVCPIAPIGTELICTAKDLTTGEEVVRTYKWHSLGSALMSWLWKWLKRLFVRNTG